MAQAIVVRLLLEVHRLPGSTASHITPILHTSVQRGAATGVRRWSLWYGVVLVVALLLLRDPAWADVYACADGRGGARYQNAPCTGDAPQPILRTEEQPSSTAASPRHVAPTKAPVRAAPEASQTERDEARRQARQQALRDVQFEDVQQEERAVRLVLRGKVRNEGRQRVDNIWLQVEWQDDAGKVIDTSIVYAVGTPGLEPGQAKSWTTSTRRSARITRYQFFLVDN